MKRAILNKLGVKANKDIPIDDLFSPEINAENYGLDTKDLIKLQVLKTFCCTYNAEVPTRKRIRINSVNDAVDLMFNTLRDLDHEEVWVVYLTKANGVISRERICVGGLDQATMDSRRIVKRALDINAKSFILFHNHPSGDPKPSKCDLAETDKLRKMAEVFEMQLVDHIIISESQCFSFAEENAFCIKKS